MSAKELGTLSIKSAPLFCHRLSELDQALPGNQVSADPGYRVANRAGTDIARISLTRERPKSIGHRRHARQEEAIDVNAGRQVSEAFERPHQGLEPRDRHAARRIEKMSLAIEIVSLLDLTRSKAARL